MATGLGKETIVRYALIIERTSTGYSAYPPDLPGVGVAGRTIEEIHRLAQEAIEFHLEALRAHGDPIPEPTTRASYVDVVEVG
jgi:predicted RNase H-like HicB family nuclease